jgi:hypothetical protein
MPGRPNSEGTTPFHGKSDDFSSGYRKRAAGFCRMWKSHETTKVAGSKLVQETWKNKPWKSVHLAVKNRWLAMKNVKFTLWFFDHFLASFGSFFMFCSDVDLPSLNFTIFHTCLNPLNFTMNFHSAFRDFIASEPIPLVFSCLIAVNVWNPLAWTCACPWGRGVPVVMPRSWKLCS